MYSTSVTPLRCVREALGEQYSTLSSASKQKGPTDSSSLRSLLSAASGLTSLSPARNKKWHA